MSWKIEELRAGLDKAKTHLDSLGLKTGHPTSQCFGFAVNVLAPADQPAITQDPSRSLAQELEGQSRAVGIHFRISGSRSTGGEPSPSFLDTAPDCIFRHQSKNGALERVVADFHSMDHGAVGLQVVGRRIYGRPKSFVEPSHYQEPPKRRLVQSGHVGHCCAIVPVQTSGGHTVYSIVDSLTPGGVSHHWTIDDAVASIESRYSQILKVFPIDQTLDSK